VQSNLGVEFVGVEGFGASSKRLDKEIATPFLELYDPLSSLLFSFTAPLFERKTSTRKPSFHFENLQLGLQDLKILRVQFDCGLFF
jgi:hypothetical protein